MAVACMRKTLHLADVYALMKPLLLAHFAGLHQYQKSDGPQKLGEVPIVVTEAPWKALRHSIETHHGGA